MQHSLHSVLQMKLKLYILFLLINSKIKQVQIYQESPDRFVLQKGNFQKGLK